MKKISTTRVVIAVVVVALCFVYLIQGLAKLQLVQGEKYAETAGKQSLKTLRITGTRGMITDAESVILAMSEDVYNVTFYRRDTSTADEYLAYTKSIIEAIDIIENNGGEISVEFVIGRNEETGLLEYQFGEGISESAWQSRSKRWRENHYITGAKYDDPQVAYDLFMDRYQFDVLAEQGLTYDEETVMKVLAVYNEMQMNVYNSVPVVIAEDVNFATVAEIEGRSMMLSGFDIEVGSKRVYPRGSLASQIIGYVGPISSYETYEAELKPLGYKLTDVVGKDGIESSMENWLTANIESRSGYRVMEKNNTGSLTRELEYLEPQDGNNVKLTIIASYQQAAERAIEENVRSTRNRQETKMAEGNWLETNKEKIAQRDWDKYPLKLAETGVLVVLNIEDGNVLAMAQYPTYDLNVLIAGGDEAAEILLDERNVMMNYAIQQKAEPGSVFKMVTALAALVNKKISPTDTISDGGPYMQYTTNEADAPVCWIAKSQRSDHSNQTVIQGLSNSCNYFFYELGSRLYNRNEGSLLLYSYAEEMGLTKKTGIDLPGEVRGVVGNQANLYDPSVSLYEQRTWQPRMVANSIRNHLLSIGESYGIFYDDKRLDACIKRLMDMAVTTDQGNWIVSMRPILMEELNMTRDMVMLAATMNDIYNYLNDIKWGGSMEIQTAIGQGITLVTPAAMSRYIAALGNGGKVFNLNIIDSIISPEGEVISKRTKNLLNELEGVGPYLPYIKAGMEGVVDESGTANKYFKDWAYKNDIWAKTGTSQVTIGGIKLDLENNAWFCALTPFEQAEIAVICFVPNGYSGGEASLGARNFIEWWMKEREKDTGEMAVVPGNEMMP